MLRHAHIRNARLTPKALVQIDAMMTPKPTIPTKPVNKVERAKPTDAKHKVKTEFENRPHLFAHRH